MFEGLYRLLTGQDGAPEAARQNDTAFALAVLLIEVARSDDRLANIEESVIERTLSRRFGLNREEVLRLVEAAEERALQATDLFHFTQAVVENFSEAERVGVVEMLWEVAYADGELTGGEDSLIRRVAGLIYVSDRDRGEAKRRVRERLRS
ncbi:MAG TPA: TerB family tellurite resistance protein [Stellaceae bacterium]|nr:TerB family tellurite resistance protein [Stellaceae bacterium]